MSMLLSYAVLAASASPSPSPSSSPTAVDESRVSAGLLGLLSLVLLAVAVFFIFRSMNKQLKRVDFDEAATVRRAEPSPTDLPADVADSATPEPQPPTG